MARTVRRSAAPGPAPTRSTSPTGVSGCMTFDSTGSGATGEEAGDFGAARPAVGTCASGGDHRVDSDGASVDGPGDDASAHLQAGADDRALIGAFAYAAAGQQRGPVARIELRPGEQSDEPLARWQGNADGRQEQQPLEPVAIQDRAAEGAGTWILEGLGFADGFEGQRGNQA